MAVSTDLVVKAGPVIWIARLRTDRVAIFQASASKISNAAASAAATGLVEIASAVVEDSAAVIALGVAASAEAALADSGVAVAGLGAGDNN